MNSFVHGGIHPLRRNAEGFPVHLALQVLGNANALATMTGMALAILTGDEAIVQPMSKIQPEFADCLPELLEVGLVAVNALGTSPGIIWPNGARPPHCLLGSTVNSSKKVEHEVPHIELTAE